VTEKKLLYTYEVVFNPGFQHKVFGVERIEVHADYVYFIDKYERTFSVVYKPMIVRIVDWIEDDGRYD